MHEARRRPGPGLAVLALCVPGPPFGLLAWVLASGEDRPAYLRSWWVRIGIALLLIGSAPLLIIILAAQVGLWPDPDPDPNPVGAGLLFFLPLLWRQFVWRSARCGSGVSSDGWSLVTSE